MKKIYEHPLMPGPPETLRRRWSRTKNGRLIIRREVIVNGKLLAHGTRLVPSFNLHNRTRELTVTKHWPKPKLS